MELLVYNEEMQNKSQEHLASLNRIRRDVVGGCRGFFLVYQPIVNAEDENVIGMEALIRYRDEKGGSYLRMILFPGLRRIRCFMILAVSYSEGPWRMQRG